MTFTNGIVVGAIGILAVEALFLGGVLLGHRLAQHFKPGEKQG